MGLGSTAKRLSKVTDLAEDLYTRVQQLREEVAATRETVTDTNERVESLEAELAEQRAVLEALAEERGLDPAELAAATDPDAAGSDTDGSESGTADAAGTASGDDATAGGT
jgi:septal ring factor EnvC (AmiA/AmiB activator)